MFDLYYDKYLAFDWANNLIAGKYGNWVVLDTETTGLGSTDEIIELAIISKYGSTMLDTLIKPTCSISEGARNVHHIQDSELADAPTFPDIYPRLQQILTNNLVLIYNASFDYSKIKYQCQLHNLEIPKFQTACAMNWYAQYFGSWHDYYQNYTWQKLPGGSHRAKGDAIATYNLIHRMAQIHSCPVSFDILFPPFQIALNFLPWLTISFSKVDPDRRSWHPKHDLDSTTFVLKKPKIYCLKSPQNSSSGIEVIRPKQTSLGSLDQSLSPTDDDDWDEIPFLRPVYSRTNFGRELCDSWELEANRYWDGAKSFSLSHPPAL